jgi:hypothetical protein
MVEVVSAGNYYISSASNEAWDALGPQTLSDGYTVEARLKVISDNGSLAAISIQSRPKNGNANNYMSYLNIAEDGLSWASNGSVSLGSYDNTDDFHVFRIAQEADGSCTVWRDGLLVANNLSISSTSTAGRLVFGDVDLGNARRGEVQVDYIRFTTGAYAIPEPSALVILLCGAAVMMLRRR